MTTGRFQVHEGMAVLGADQRRVGQVAEVRASDFVIERPPQRAIAVPFGASGDVAGHQHSETGSRTGQAPPEGGPCRSRM
jgi:hypothetical protein